jgi:PAS domain S-box-containing protein
VASANQGNNDGMSLAARLYIGLVISLGILALGYGFYYWQVTNLTRFLWYLALAIPASCLKVRLPGIKVGTMSVLFMFVLGATVELNLPETLALGSVCVIVQSLWHSKFGARFVQVSFSVAAIAIAIVATDLAYRSIPFMSGVLRLAVAVTIFFITNTVPIAIVIGLTERTSPISVWKTSYLWCFPYYLVGAGIVTIQFSKHLLDWQVGILIMPVVYIIYRSYRLYLNQLQYERDRAEEEHRHAAELQALHAQAVEALASAMTANAQLDAVFRASPLAFITLDREAKVTTWNSAAERIFGWRAEEVIGNALPFTSDTAEQLQTSFDQTLRGDPVQGLELTQRRRDGSRFDAAMWTAALGNAQNVSGILLTVDDISVRKRLQEELRFAQKMEAIGRLAGGVAHDFNNLLTAIVGYNGFLIDQLSSQPELLGFARHVQGAADRAAVLTSRLLTFSRRQVSAPRMLNINSSVTNIQNLITRLIGEDIEIVTDFDRQVGSIRLDPVELDQVVMNLAVNARDAMPNGGRLTFETANVTITPQQATETGCAGGEYVLLRVRDTGCGMDAETKSRLFEPFFTTKEQGKGTGLGLSIIYGVMQQAGGFIGVESEPGAGVTFSLYFPRCADAENVDESTKAPVAAPLASDTTVLLVEDEPTVRQLTAMLLRANGYRIIETGTPAEAIPLAREHRDSIRLLVTDVLMPGMRGNELAEHVRELCPGLPVLYMSGYSDSTFLRPGALKDAHFLQKPFTGVELIRVVGEVLRSASGASLNRN